MYKKQSKLLPHKWVRPHPNPPGLTHQNFEVSLISVSAVAKKACSGTTRCDCFGGGNDVAKAPKRPVHDVAQYMITQDNHARRNSRDCKHFWVVRQGWFGTGVRCCDATKRYTANGNNFQFFEPRQESAFSTRFRNMRRRGKRRNEAGTETKQEQRAESSTVPGSLFPAHCSRSTIPVPMFPCY